MWRVIWFFLGVSRLSITGASPEWCMQRLAKARIAFHFCAKPDDFTAEIWILRRDEARAAQQIRMGGCDCAVLERSGFSARRAVEAARASYFAGSRYYGSNSCAEVCFFL